MYLRSQMSALFVGLASNPYWLRVQLRCQEDGPFNLKFMRNIIPAVLSGAALIAVPACAQSVLFDFDNASPHSPLPLSLTVGEITAQFSATGQGFSIQEANAMGFTPAGFSGYCLYPSSVFAADLLIGFSQSLTGFSILYAPQELACDSSARMKVTAYLNDSLVGSNTTNANAGTWPSETLAFSSVPAVQSLRGALRRAASDRRRLGSDLHGG